MKDVDPFLKEMADEAAREDGSAEKRSRRLKTKHIKRKSFASALASEEDKPSFNRLLKVCRDQAEEAKAVEKQLQVEFDAKLDEALASVFRLEKYIDTSSSAEKKLRKAYKDARIRITGKTTNEFTPLLKLIFRDVPRATLSRYASVLRFAKQKGIEPDGFVGFVREEGGVTACDRLAVQKRRTADRVTQTKMKKHWIEKRRKVAPIFRMPREAGLPPEGLVVMLVIPKPNGKCLYLGHRPASDHDVSAFGKE